MTSEEKELQHKAKTLRDQGKTLKQIAQVFADEGILYKTGRPYDYKDVSKLINYQDAPKNKGGRPCNWTPEVKDKVVKWIKDALVSRRDCARRLGISPANFQDKLKRDADFLVRVQQAEQEARDQLVEAVIKHGKDKDFKACLTMLQSKHAAEFSRKPGQFTGEDFRDFCLKVSDLIRKHLPPENQVKFGQEFAAIIEDMEKQKKKQEYL